MSRLIDHFDPGVVIEPTKAADKSSSKALTQTDPVPHRSFEVQTIEQKDEETQTGASDFADSSSSHDLSSFLARVGPMVEDQLIKNLTSTAFDGYSVHWQDNRSEIVLLHQLYRKSTPNSEIAEAENISDLSWNCTGHLLAVSYGSSNHDNLCVHAGKICGWNLTRKFVKESLPDVTIDLPACVTCIAFHAEDPTMIAAGLFNGGISICRVLSGSESELYSNCLKSDSHLEPVAKVDWIFDPIERNYKLLSVAGDGKIMLWSLKNQLSKPIAITDLRECGSSAARDRSYKSRGKILAATSLHVSPLDPGGFLVATEGGGIFKCLINFNEVSTLLRRNESAAQSSMNVFKVLFAYDPHAGSVSCCRNSPFMRSIFATCGIDSQLRIYHALKPNALRSLEPSSAALTSAAWAPARPLVLLAAAADGFVYVYDFHHSVVNYRHKLSVTDQNSSSVQAVKFNGVFTDTVAAASDSGVIRVWQLSSSLCDPLPNEEQFFDEIVDQV